MVRGRIGDIAWDWQRPPRRATGIRLAALVDAAFCMSVWGALTLLALALT